MTLPQPIEAMAQYLADLDIGTYRTSGVYTDNEVAIYLDFMEVKPDQVIVVSTLPGPIADSKLQYDEPIIQIRFRGTSDPIISRRRAADVYNRLHGLGPISLSGIEFQLLIVQGSGPEYVGRDENKRHHHQILVEATIHNPDRLGV